MTLPWLDIDPIPKPADGLLACIIQLSPVYLVLCCTLAAPALKHHVLVLLLVAHTRTHTHARLCCAACLARARRAPCRRRCEIPLLAAAGQRVRVRKRELHRRWWIDGFASLAAHGERVLLLRVASELDYSLACHLSHVNALDAGVQLFPQHALVTMPSSVVLWLHVQPDPPPLPVHSPHSTRKPTHSYTLYF